MSLIEFGEPTVLQLLGMTDKVMEPEVKKAPSKWEKFQRVNAEIRASQAKTAEHPALNIATAKDRGGEQKYATQEISNKPLAQVFNARIEVLNLGENYAKNGFGIGKKLVDAAKEEFQDIIKALGDTREDRLHQEIPPRTLEKLEENVNKFRLSFHTSDGKLKTVQEIEIPTKE
ncbi:MAG TPA: hypothetical protein VF185_00370 [Patescibacteria group bacterium]